MATHSLVIRVAALTLVAAVHLLTGCGADDSGGSKEDPPVIVAADAVPAACDDEGYCLWLVTAQVDREYDPADYELAVTGQPGLVEPWACASSNVVPFGDKLGAGVRDVLVKQISWRVCVWDKGAGTYSTGLVFRSDVSGDEAVKAGR